MNRTLFALVTSLLVASFGCLAEDPTGLRRRAEQPGDNPDYPVDGIDRKDATTTSAEVEVEGSVDPSDAGTAPVVDAAPPLNAFTNAPAFSTITPATDSTRPHNKAGNAGFDCLGCHTGSGAPKFLIAGTVYGTKAGGLGLKGAQVRIVDPAGNEIALTGTDSVGNFWVKGGTLAALPAGSKVGVRNGTSTKLMAATIGAGSCNQSNCHVPATRPIFVLD